MKWYGILSILTSLFFTTHAIFADEAFHIDYHHALLGVPQSHTTFFHKPQTSTSASLLYTISDKGVLGAVNPKDGSLVWRQVLAEKPVQNATSSFLVAGQRNGQIVSGHGQTVSCWDALDGKLIWEYALTKGTIIGGLQAVHVAGPSTDSAIQDAIVLALPIDGHAHAAVSRIAGDGTGLKWEHVDSSTSQDSSASIAVSPERVYYVTKSHGILAGDKASVVTLDIATGKTVGTSSVAVGSEPLGQDGHYTTASSSGFPFLISADKPYTSVRFNLLSASKAVTLTLDNKGEDLEDVIVHHATEPGAPAHFLLHFKGKAKQWAQVYHIDTKSGDVTKAYSLPATAESSTFSASGSDADLFFTRNTETELSLYSSESHGQLGRWPRVGARATSSGSFPSHAAAEVVSRGKATYAVRIAEASSSGDWSLIRNGELQWTRPEMLAYANIAAWAENVDSDPLAGELEAEASIDPVTAYFHRLQRHVSDLVGLPKYLAGIPEAIFKSTPESESAAIKSLIGTKVVVVGTTRKELIALDASNAGTLKWQTDLSSQIADGVKMKSLTVDDGRTTLYLSDGSVIVVNTATGSVIEAQPGTIPISRLITLPGNPAPAVVKVSSDGTPQLANDFAPANPLEGNVVVTISGDGKAVGWSIGHSVEKTWILQPPEGMKFTSAYARPARYFGSPTKSET